MASVLEKAKDKFAGIFGTDESKKQSNEPINTPQQQKLVAMVQRDFEEFKSTRQSIEKHWRQEQQFYMGDHWKGLRPESALRPNSKDNIIGSQVESIVGKLTGWSPYPDFEAQEEGDEQKAADLNDYMPYELRQIKFQQKYIRAVRRMVIHGPLIFKTVYDPTVEGGRGMNRWTGQNDIIPVDLGTFFPDPRVKDFINLQDMGAIIVKSRKTLEYFKERWQGQGKKVTSDDDTDDIEIFNHESTNSEGFNRDYGASYGTGIEKSSTAGLIEYWYRGLPKMISSDDKEIFNEQAETKLMDGKDPSESLAKANGDMEGIHCIYISADGVFLEHKAYVYDHGKYPFTARTLYPDERNVWGKGFVRDMISPQIMLNKFAEIAVETMAKQGNGGMMYEEGAITSKQVNTWKEMRSQPGAMLPVATGGIARVKELEGINVPSTVFNMLEYYKEMLQKLPGQFDSANGQASSNVTSGEQAKSLMAAASTRLNTVTDTIEEALQDVFEQYIELMAQFYTTERVARVTGRSVSVSRDSLVSQVPSQYDTGNTAIDPMTNEEVPDIRDVTEEYVPTFDILVNISSDKPHDREYWIQMAFNMLQMQDPVTQLPMIDGEAVRYTIQNGRMEPMDVIKRRVQEESGLQQQIQQMQEQFGQLQQQNQQMQQQLGELTSQKQMQEQQDREFNQQVQQQKLDIEASKVAGGLMNQIGGGV
ncbi:hypothetical protein [Paenibacillus ottowii]|uniref:Portal protein n=1 Tax=Paenibacillus ottowii TaxID=2315729 RepID=A0ABY3B0V5_9BACL|nr:hypothetical protein [Paenibacillus ottowii]TQR97318.1 hypothetical protein FKV70_18985 [Paenibacillus ottowii]